tara:strand:+ start:21605 stop:22030 length:426 start_codon:yes stop_codon:yes gene_type:complete
MKNKILSENVIIDLLRNYYEDRLNEALWESDVIDDDGNILITRDLKVRHKDSQYEYTVDDVLEDPETGKIDIVLRLPDEPRFDPPPDQEDTLISDKKIAAILGEDELINLDKIQTELIPDDPDEEVFVVDQEEFEKEYEVK